MTDAGLENWNRALEMDPRIPSLGVDIGRALLELKGDATGALPAFEREVTSGDASNPGGYYGVDQALSLLNRPASERVSALRRYPDAENMPTNMVYELALALSESGDHASAEKLFYHRHFMRAEGGTNVRQIWIEVRLQHALAMAREGQCQSALSIGSQLGSAVPDLDFTRDGLEPILRNARVQYLLGKLASDCGNAEQARSHFEQAAGDTSPIGAAWASMAAKRLGNYDDRKWRSLLEASRAAEDRRENSLGAYAAAMSERELGDEAAAETGFHKALLLPDGQMAYHLARLAIADEKK
jgi:tetratricopeptide (TPR) repeat protein